MARITERNDWFGIWYDDKCAMIETMTRNMQADLEAGYNPAGHSIRKQTVEIEEYEMRFDREMELLKYMDWGKVQHWCYMDLKKRGVIS